MVNRFVRIRLELISVNGEESCDLPIDPSSRFDEKAKAYGTMMKEINVITKSL